MICKTSPNFGSSSFIILTILFSRFASSDVRTCERSWVQFPQRPVPSFLPFFCHQKNATKVDTVLCWYHNVCIEKRVHSNALWNAILTLPTANIELELKILKGASLYKSSTPKMKYSKALRLRLSVSSWLDIWWQGSFASSLCPA